MANQETLEREASFYDSLTERIEINDASAKSMFDYDSPLSNIAECQPSLKKEILQCIGDVTRKRILVYGCGNDNAAIYFAKAGAIVDAIDISPKSVENQKRIANFLNLNINVQCMDAHSLDLPSDEYDIVYGNAILHHLSLHVASAEISRVLKTGGKAIFRDVMVGNIFLRAFRFATPFWRTPDEHPLNQGDFSLIAEKFPIYQVSYYILSGLPYLFFVRIINRVILNTLGTKLRMPQSKTINAAFDSIDKVLFQLMPFLKNQAWFCLIVTTKNQ